ncbi:hypothetical protein [Campylobacter gastrosuis]|uniref:Uncharacterized protein n=1 Tax=Campylobacter gastrosuis TaxID=2974576 RepID=A0ABT7HQ33_9BACT|nr:hypothetical protein [Campylobacter gastrosuis]MDL0088538.1 hypothetical protein [Campylobacter gastrosuis]
MILRASGAFFGAFCLYSLLVFLVQGVFLTNRLAPLIFAALLTAMGGGYWGYLSLIF